MTIRELDGTPAESLVVGRDYEAEENGVRFRVHWTAPAPSPAAASEGSSE